jgi:hypothetical protein
MRWEYAEVSQEQLGHLVDTEPQDDQRNQRQQRDVANHLQAGVESNFHFSERSGQQTEDETEPAADGETGKRPAGADPDVGP